MRNAIDVTVEKLVVGGQGLAHLSDGMVVLIPHVLPGEHVAVKPVRRKKQFMQARAVAIHKISPYRTKPPCPYFTRCGGCDFQHVLPEKQTELKNKILHEQLQRSPLTFYDKNSLTAPLASPRSFYYRQRIRLHVAADGQFGFRRFHSHEVEAISACLLASEQINEVLTYLHANNAFYAVAEQVQTVELLFSPVDGQVVVLLHMVRKPRAAEKKSLAAIASECGLIKSIVLSATGYGFVASFDGRDQGTVKPLLSFSHPLPGGDSLQMTLEAGGFCQVNLEQNENLINLVLDWAQAGPQQRVLDLFCGMGNFSLPLARRGSQVTGMDLQRSAIRSANRNAEQNDITNCRFSKRSALDGARELAGSGETFDLVLLDPPRQGCAEVVPYLPQFAAERIIYISCDPATLCRDLVLLEKEGYRTDKVKMVDMFPQTHHLETVVLLKKG